MSPAQSLSIKDAAAFLKVSEKTLRRWEEKNILVPERTTGKHRRYTLEVISKFKKNKKQIVSQVKKLNQTLPVFSSLEDSKPPITVNLISEPEHGSVDLENKNIEVETLTEEPVNEDVIQIPSIASDNLRTENKEEYNRLETIQIVQDIYKNSPRPNKFIVKNYAKVFAVVTILLISSNAGASAGRSSACRMAASATPAWRSRRPSAPRPPASRRGSGSRSSSACRSGPWRRTGCRGRC